MPFGLTGAPSCFNEVTGRALHGLVDTMIQLFVDDRAMAGDVFHGQTRKPLNILLEVL